jgi:hypothetical protein
MFATVSIKKTSVQKTAISPKPSTNGRGRAPGYISFFKNSTGWCLRYDLSAKQQAPSVKHQAPIFRKKTLTKLANS